MNHHQTRLNQIRVRMLGVDSRDFIEKMDKDCSDDEMETTIRRQRQMCIRDR